MKRHILTAAALLLTSTALASAAHADNVRSRMAQQRAPAFEQVRPAPPANTAATLQHGHSHAAGISQTGTGNAADLRQFGHTNTGTIGQAGNHNTACFVQTGSNLNGAVQQVGDHNSMAVLQTRWSVTNIPMEVCTSATSRGDVMPYALERSGNTVRGRTIQLGLNEP